MQIFISFSDFHYHQLNIICTLSYFCTKYITVSSGPLGYSDPFDVLVFLSVTLLFNNHLQIAFNWLYCFVACTYREISYSFHNTFTELQVVPLFDLFFVNLLFKLLRNRVEYVLYRVQTIWFGLFREQTPENISHPRNSQAS